AAGALDRRGPLCYSSSMSPSRTLLLAAVLGSWSPAPRARAEAPAAPVTQAGIVTGKPPAKSPTVTGEPAALPAAPKVLDVPSVPKPTPAPTPAATPS